MVRSCVEGPVFRGDRVRWDAFDDGVGRVPGRRRRRAADGGALMAPRTRSSRRRPVHRARRHVDAAEPADDRLRLRRQRQGAATGSSTSPSSGAFVTKSVMADPRSGRGTPRMAETPSGMLNSIGLQGPGIHAFVEQRPRLAQVRSAPASLVSIAGSTQRRVRRRRRACCGERRLRRVVGVEVNISCPNVANRGLVFACDPLASAKVVALVREQLPRDIPIFAKLSPDVTDIVGVAAACVEGRRRRADHDQHAAGHGHRHRPAAAPARRRDRWAVAVRRSGRSRSGPSGRSARRCSRAGSRRCRSSASGECAPAATRSSWSPPAPAPSRSARPPSTTPPHRCGVLRELGGPVARTRVSTRSREAVGVAHRRQEVLTGDQHPFGARLRAAMDAYGPLCAGIDPHRGAASSSGGCRTTSPGWSGSR